MNIEQDRWLYVYCKSAQRAREFLGFPPDTEVRLSEEQIEGTLPCWAVKVPPQQPKPAAKPLWSDKGKIRLECRFCDAQHDMIADFPPGWTDIEEVRSWERATAPVPDEPGYNHYGDTNSDWQTHFGVCPECRPRAEASVNRSPSPREELLDKLGDLPGIEKVDLPPPPVAKPKDEELFNKQIACIAKGHLLDDSNSILNRALAVVAKGLLMDNGGFTLDEYGESVSGDFWAVSVPGKEQKCSGRPSIDEIKAYLDYHCSPGAAHFGGWYDRSENVTYLDHTLLFAHKHTAIAEGLKNKQKAIYNLQTGETLELAEFSSNS